MTVKEIFDLRKQGKIEEAYEAIRPMYTVHKGKYTTLCMFWTASDILKKRVLEGRLKSRGRFYCSFLAINSINRTDPVIVCPLVATKVLFATRKSEKSSSFKEILLDFA
jgi:hypothetical protein